MKKDFRKYKVYLVGTGNGCYADDYAREFLGEVWARSEKEACSRVRYRHRDDDAPNGGYSDWVLGDRFEEGIVHFHYEAELV